MDTNIYKTITVTAGPSAVTVSVAELASVIRVEGTVILAGGYTISPSGSPVEGQRVVFECRSVVTIGANVYEIFGFRPSAQQALKNMNLICTYKNAAWDVVCVMNHDQTEIIESANIKNLDITGAKIANLTIDIPTKTTAITRGSLIRGEAAANAAFDCKGAGDFVCGDGTDVTATTMSGDATLASGVLTISADAVDNTKLANITRGSIKVGGVADAPTDLDAKTSGQILVGDGTDVVSVPVTGAISMSAAGVTAFTSNALTRSLHVNTTTAGNGAVVTETKLHSYTLPANTVNADTMGLYIKAYGTVSANVSNKTIKLYLGGTGGQLLVQNNTTANPASTNWMIECFIWRTGSALQKGYGTILFNGVAHELDVFTGAQDFTTNLDIDLTGQDSVGAGATDIVCEATEIMLIRQ